MGGSIYQVAGERWGYEKAFTIIVALGGLFCASSWWAIRFLPAHLLGRPQPAGAGVPPMLLPELPPLAELAIEPPQRRI
jgi:hypothetical protein